MVPVVFLAENLFHHISVDVGEAIVPTAMEVGEVFMIDTHEMKQGGMEIMDIDFVFHGIVAEVVGLPVVISGFHPSSGEPGGESVRVMVSSILMPTGNTVEKFKGGSSAKFTAADDEGIVEHAANL